MFQVKGKRNIRVREIGLSVANMNKGDCFILENDRDIFVYVGPNSKRVEKLKAISAANQIRDQDHNGRAVVHILDEYSTFDDQQRFFDVLGEGSPNAVPDESAGEDDADFETRDANAVTLYKVSDAAGALRVDTISTKPIRQEMLKTEVCEFLFQNELEIIDVFLFNSGLFHFGYWFSPLCMGWQRRYPNRKITGNDSCPR